MSRDTSTIACMPQVEAQLGKLDQEHAKQASEASSMVLEDFGAADKELEAAQAQLRELRRGWVHGICIPFALCCAKSVFA